MSNPIVNQVETAEQELARLRAENEALKRATVNTGSSLKVTEKGGLSCYGLGRFPVTLYKSQWLKLISMTEQIKGFIDANQDKLKDKPSKQGVVEEQVEVA